MLAGELVIELEGQRGSGRSSTKTETILLTAVCGALVLLGASAGSAAVVGQSTSSVGFVIPQGKSEMSPPTLTCAIGLPRLAAGLYCATPLAKTRQYDGRGVVRVTPRGAVIAVPSGNDLLLAIDGDRPAATRDRLERGDTFIAGGYRCTHAVVITCSREGHGFRLEQRLAIF